MLLVHLGNKKKTPTVNLAPGTINGPYYEREGYPRKDIGASIGDAMALTFNTDQQPVTVGGKSIMSSCSVVTIDNVRSAGLRVQASPNSNATERTYIDGQGSAIIPVSTSGLPIPPDSDECRYGLQDNLASVTVATYQPYFITASAIQDEITRSYKSAPAINGISGVELYRRTFNKDSLQYVIRKNSDLTFSIIVSGTKDNQAAMEKLVKIAITNTNRLTSKPEGPLRATYTNSPTYKEKYLRACSFLDDEGMQVLTGTKAAAFVTEGFANSSAVSQYKSLKDETLYLSVSNECEREGTGGGIAAGGTGLVNTTPHILVKSTSFKEVKGAEQDFAQLPQSYKDKYVVNGLGDGAVVVRNSVGENQLLFRKGRFVLDMTYNTLNQKSGGLDDQITYANALKEYANYVIQKIGDAQ